MLCIPLLVSRTHHKLEWKLFCDRKILSKRQNCPESDCINMPREALISSHKDAGGSFPATEVNNVDFDSQGW